MKRNCVRNLTLKNGELSQQRYSFRDKEFRVNVKHACPRKGRSFAHSQLKRPTNLSVILLVI